MGTADEDAIGRCGHPHSAARTGERCSWMIACFIELLVLLRHEAESPAKSHCERSEAIQESQAQLEGVARRREASFPSSARPLDCFASLAMTRLTNESRVMTQ
jgi:hypothetical protein